MTEVVKCCGTCTFYISDVCVDGEVKTTYSIPCHSYEHKKVKPVPKSEPKFKLGQTVRKVGGNRVWTIQRLLNSHLGAAISSYELQCISGFNPNTYFTAYATENELELCHPNLQGIEGPDNTEYYRVSVEQKFDQRLAKLEQELVENAQNDSTIAQRLSTLEQAVLKLVNKKE